MEQENLEVQKLKAIIVSKDLQIRKLKGKSNNQRAALYKIAKSSGIIFDDLVKDHRANYGDIDITSYPKRMNEVLDKFKDLTQNK
jgi:hypothetical protein